jgi:phosphonoacetate hydrolase
MNRRHFLFGALASPLASARQSAPRRKILIVLIDGFSPDYFRRSEMPNLRRICLEGAWKFGRGVMPTLTNVGNASLSTGTFPVTHGITSNYQFHRITGEYSAMESAQYLLAETVFQRAGRLGLRTALVASKDKVRTLCNAGSDFAISGEAPPPGWVKRVGPKQEMYSPSVDVWTFRAAGKLLKEEGCDLVYATTTDYMMHTYPAGAEESMQHLHQIDAILGEIVNDHPRLEIYLTADHGMTAMHEAIDPVRVLARHGIESNAVPIIQDKHMIHHRGLGGSTYVYLARPDTLETAKSLLTATTGVEEVYSNPEAAKSFRLHPGRIGDLFVLGAKGVAFGSLPAERVEVAVRTHGSRHEEEVPLAIYGRKADISQYEFTLDLVRKLSLES